MRSLLILDLAARYKPYLEEIHSFVVSCYVFTQLIRFSALLVIANIFNKTTTT